MKNEYSTMPRVKSFTFSSRGVYFSSRQSYNRKNKAMFWSCKRCNILQKQLRRVTDVTAVTEEFVFN